MKYALVTGASSGIGKEFAKLLDERGYHVILVARREEKLRKVQEQLKNESMILLKDLTNENDCYRLYEEIKDLDLEVFINNAGFGDCGYFIERDLTKEVNMINLNMKAMHILFKLVLKDMVSKDHGSILNVASSAGLIPAGPYMSTYYATKAYVTSLTRGVAEELREHHSHVYVGCLCPGPVDTEFNQVADVEFSLKGISAFSCASYALKMMDQKKITIIPGLPLKLANFFGRFVPVKYYVRIVAHQQKRKIYR